MTADVGAIADELYGLPTRDFTAGRDRIAAETRRAGDRALATAIKQLRRPTATAWSANQLVRQRCDEIAHLLEVGVALRDAQTRLAGDDLRRLTQEGQRLVTDLGRQARQLAADAGQSLSEEAVRELEETLHAALADPAASDALRSGHLTVALHYSGFGLVDLPTAPGSPQRGGRPEPLSSSSPGSPVSRPGPRHPETSVSRPVVVDAGAAPGVVEPEVTVTAAAEQAVRDAEADLAAAQQDAADQARRAEDATERHTVLRGQIDQLNEQIKGLRVDEAEAAQAARQAAREQRAAERARQAAEDRLELARDTLDRPRRGA